MKKHLLLWILLAGGCLAGNAQETHFSMFYQNPIALNPALTGMNECIMRIGGIYRDQWRTIGKPYTSYSFFTDARLQPYKMKHDAFGVGLTFTGDKAGTAGLTRNDFKVTFGYHKGLIKDNRLIVSLGLSMGFVNHSINEGMLYFGSQWNGTAFSTALPSNEHFVKNSVYYFDMNAGLMTTLFITDYTIWTLGATFSHFTMPNYSFFGYENRLGLKTTLFTGLNAVVTPRTFIMPKVMYVMQEGAKDFVFGFNAAYYPGIEPIYMGLWYRWMSDLTPVVGASVKGFNIMLSYDINMSRFNPATKYHGGFEISLVKNFLCADPFFYEKNKYSKDGKRKCPVF